MAKVLGRGLGALIKDAKNQNRSFDFTILTDQIVTNKHQPRQKFNTGEMENLINSIKNNGILQPLTVRKIKTS